MLSAKRQIINLSLLLLLFVSCSTQKPIIIEKPIIREIIIPPDTLLAPIYLNADSLTSEFIDSLNNVIATVKIDLDKRLSKLQLNQRVATIKDTLKDTIYIYHEKEKLIPIATELLTTSEKIILFGGLGLLVSLIIYKRAKGL